MSDRDIISGQVDAALVRETLEALCRRDGVPLDSSASPGEPARNYELAERLGIGEVFGISTPKYPLLTELQALRWYVDVLGYEILTDGAPFQLADGRWSPLTLGVRDPLRLLKSAIRHLERHRL